MRPNNSCIDVIMIIHIVVLMLQDGLSFVHQLMYSCYDTVASKSSFSQCCISLSSNVKRPMKYLSADLLPKVFHGLISIIYLWYTQNSY